MGATKELTLSNGKKITVDVSTLTLKEWRGFWDLNFPEDEENKVISRLTGLKIEVFDTILRDDYRRIIDMVIKLSNRPLDDPNSVSESITES